MKLKAEMGAWSSVVGGGVLLIAEDGSMAGQIAFMCHEDTLRDRATQEKLARLCCDAINRADLSAAAIRKAREDALREAAKAVRARYVGDNNREDLEVLRCEAAILALIKKDTK